ncbi:MAG TPA: hypothetical protein VN962_24670 [Polyangia bacterium]|nr:hypothetical protein [Polyangia bacterium]
MKTTATGGQVGWGAARGLCAALVLAMAGACGSSAQGGGTGGGGGSSLGSATGGQGMTTGGAGGGAGAAGGSSPSGTGGAAGDAVAGGGTTGGAGTIGGTGGGGGGAMSMGGGPGMGGTGGGVVAGHPPWVELASGQVNVQGGVALSPGGVGQNGGLVHLIAVGDVAFDPSQPAVPAQTVPATPAGATAVDAAALAADVTVTGDASITGAVSAGGADAARTVTVGGDLYISGTLRTADLGASRQGLTLQVGGTLYVSGTIDASGASGQAGGAVKVARAKQVVVTGKIITAGGDGAMAGPVEMHTTQGTFVTGTIDASGGNLNTAGTLVAGAGAQVKVQATGDVAFGGTLLIRGGGAANSAAGAAQGGDGGSLVIDSNGAVTIAGVVDGRGGLAKAAGAGGTVAGGKAGEIHIGEYAAPKSLAILVPLVATGGDGTASAGIGGTLTPAPGTGSFVVAGAHAVDLSGGNSSAKPGAGGLLNGGPRTDPGSGGVHVTGDITVNGGSILAGGSGNGADGGRIDMELTPTDGAVLIDQTGNIVVSGGASGGTGTAGGGGHVWFWTKDGDITCAGHVTTNGGDAPDAGGKGGLSGMIYFFSDNNHNAVEVPKGNLLIATTGVLTSNGGNGATGGDSRNYGMPGTVAPFGDGDAAKTQEEIAILLNCDGEHGNTNNWMQNAGWLYADGGAHNGHGGDIVYHGIPPMAREDPKFDSYGDYPVPSGNIENKGDGTGLNGSFAGE